MPRHLLLLSAALAALGGSFFFYKLYVLNLPLTPDRTLAAWTVEARVDFHGRHGKPVKVELAVPFEPQGFVVLDETFVSRGFGLSTRQQDDNRIAVWAIRRASGQQSLYYQAVVAQEQGESAATAAPPAPVVEAPLPDDAQGAIVAGLVDRVRAHSADIATFAVETLQLLRSGARHDDFKLLLNGQDTPLALAQAALQVLTAARIPGRLAYGLALDERTLGGPESLKVRLEVHNGATWLNLDPATARLGRGDDFLVWSRGMKPLMDVEGGRDAQLSFTVSANPVQALAAARRGAEIKGSRALEFSLLALPIEQQVVYRVLLMIPIGAFVIVLLRTLIGLKSFGTFAPVLMALAFRETHLINGILLFSLIVSLGLSVRFYLEHLKLLLVPRLASVLIVVVLTMSALSLITHKLGIGAGVSVALFPMVILTMTIERMSLTWEEHGPSEAIQQALGSLAAASLGYAAMSNPLLEHVVFIFPELMLVLLAVVLLLGRYTGYRLTELGRFKALAR